MTLVLLMKGMMRSCVKARGRCKVGESQYWLVIVMRVRSRALD